MSGTAPAAKRARTRSGAPSSRIKIPACDSCHSRKIKCNKSRPCENCVKYKTDCTDSTHEVEALYAEPNGVEELKHRVAQLERLLESQASSNNNHLSNQSFPDTPVSTNSTSRHASYSATTPGGPTLTEAVEAAVRSTQQYTRFTESGPDICVVPYKPRVDDFQPAVFPTRNEANEYIKVFRRAKWLFGRLSTYPSIDECMDAVYGNVTDYDEPVSAPATVENLHLYLMLTHGMYPNSIKSAASYACVRTTLRLMWSELTLENLSLTVMEVTYLGFTGRLDEAWLALGAAIRNAHAMGLHREDGSTIKNLDGEKKEMAKILWWELYVHDRWYSLCTGRPAIIRDKDCNVSMPDFGNIQAVGGPEWQPLAFQENVNLSRIAGRIMHKLYRAGEVTKSGFSTTSNPFKPSSEQVGSRLLDELSLFRKSLPPLLQDPKLNPAALIIALKYQNARIMLFRNFLLHENETLRTQAQEEVFACAIAVTQICSEVRENLKSVPCGTMSMVLLTSAIALASYSRAHKDDENPRAGEARQALDDLAVSLKNMAAEPKEGFNRLAAKNNRVMAKIQRFGGPLSSYGIDGTMQEAPAPQQRPLDFNAPNGFGSPGSTRPYSKHEHQTYGNLPTIHKIITDTKDDARAKHDANNQMYNQISPPPLDMTASPSSSNFTSPGGPMSKFASPIMFEHQQLADIHSSSGYEPFVIPEHTNFWDGEGLHSDLEFGGFVDPFSETFLTELEMMNDVNADDWARLLV